MQRIPIDVARIQAMPPSQITPSPQLLEILKRIAAKQQSRPE